MPGDFKGVKVGDTWYRAEVVGGRLEYREIAVAIVDDDYLALQEGDNTPFLHSSLSQTLFRPTKQAALQALMDRRHRDKGDYRRWLESAEADMRVAQREFTVEFGPPVLSMEPPCN